MAKKDKHVSETPATQWLKQQGVAYTEHVYEYVDHGGTGESARQLGWPEHAVVKTLVMQDDKAEPLIILMHGDKQVSTKNLARAIGVKSVEPCKPEVAQRHSGYLVGGTSPFGTRKTMRVFVEETVLALERILINGGRRGYLVEIAPAVLTGPWARSRCTARSERPRRRRPFSAGSRPRASRTRASSKAGRAISAGSSSRAARTLDISAWPSTKRSSGVSDGWPSAPVTVISRSAMRSAGAKRAGARPARPVQQHRADHVAHHLVAPAEGAQPHRQHGPHRLARRTGLGLGHGLQRVQPALQLVLGHGHQQFLLVREVLVERAHRKAGPRRCGWCSAGPGLRFPAAGRWPRRWPAACHRPGPAQAPCASAQAGGGEFMGEGLKTEQPGWRPGAARRRRGRRAGLGNLDAHQVSGI
jgi:Cys-tRNA(Pro) deacylase